MLIIGYHKAKEYIITIETEDYKTYLKENDIIDLNNALYETKNFTVLEIEDLIGNKYDSIFDFDVDKIYNYNNHYLEFYRIKENAFYLDFILKKQWEFFPNGYSGIYKEILKDGSKIAEYFHINGVIFDSIKY